MTNFCFVWVQRIDKPLYNYELGKKMFILYISFIKKIPTIPQKPSKQKWIFSTVKTTFCTSPTTNFRIKTKNPPISRKTLASLTLIDRLVVQIGTPPILIQITFYYQYDIFRNEWPQSLEMAENGVCGVYVDGRRGENRDFY